MLGTVVVSGLRGTGRVALLFVDVIRWMLHSAPDRRVLTWQLYFVGVQSLPVILTTGAFTGMVLAYNSYFEFLRLGVASWTGPLVAKALVKQLGPVLAGLMLAGRVGGAMAAELGTMNVTEQIDALKTMGTDPVKYLVVPRVIACTLMTPVLTAFAMAIGIAAGFWLTIHGLGAESHFIWEQTRDFMDTYDYVQGLIKSAFFGCSIALICCYKGLGTRGGAEGVGKATTEANVASCICVLISNMFLTMITMMFE
jgi:phospholipid/cholesterol/gamma-HCH transport system permease protein